MEHFKLLPVEGCNTDETRQRIRLNCFGSLYFFIKVALQRKRLTETLHRPICEFLERDRLKDLLEMPRDHFKSTICSEGLPMWRTLHLSDEDRNQLVKLGYSKEYIRYMDSVHKADMRVVLTSENITNAAKLGSRIRWHFESNAVYRHLFNETIPTTKQVWTNFSLHTPRPGAAASHGEGTFDFLGVGGALQSRHYGMAIEDDLVGRKAIESPSVMDKTIDYHRLLIGAFESDDKVHENPELVVGNRWAFYDLNSWIREEEPWFNITSHSALGGCCDLHESGKTIFPEEFSAEKLLKIKKRLGTYFYSCQFLNNPSAPENSEFKPNWLNFYIGDKDAQGRSIIIHRVKDGQVRKDLYVGHLQLCMITDPNHSGETGRARHSIVVLGFFKEDMYLLDVWAERCSYDKYIYQLYKMANKWHVREIGVETIAAQKYLKYHLEYRNKIEGHRIKIKELKGEIENADGTMTRNKEWRIRNGLGPIFEDGRFWTQQEGKFQSFIEEYETFPKGRTVDILDAMAYFGQMQKRILSFEDNKAWLAANAAQANRVNRPYSVGMIN